MRAALVALSALVAAPVAAQAPRAAHRVASAGVPSAGFPSARVPSAAQPRAARALARGETLAAADIDGVGARDAGRFVGWTTRRMIAAGEPLREPAVAPPAAVRAGDAVALVYRADGVTLRLAGTAAADAPLGGRVTVRVDARRRFEGVVAAPGLVRLP
jgi:flagella basal body P-ring formation protein FlgA